MRKIFMAAAAACVLGVAAPARADIVTDWAELARVVDADDKSPWSPEGWFAQTQVALAMFEAANAVDPQYESYLKLERAPEGGSVEAAVVTAAYEVLSARFPAAKGEMDGSYQLAMSMVTDKASREIGVEAGKAAATRVLGTGKIPDGVKAVTYRPRTAPGVWVPVVLPSIRDEMTVMPLWSIESVAAYMPPPPPALTSKVWARDLNEVKRIGGKEGADRSEVESRIARYRITPVIIPTLRAIADLPGRTTVQNARMVALAYMAGDDTGVVTSAAKLHYNFWRPQTAIRNADEDGNPATEIDADWQSFIYTPNFPEYPCAHCSYAAATAEVLKQEAGNAPPGGVQVASRSLDYAAVQVLPTFDDWTKDVSQSRILGGVHYRFSNDAAEALGKRIAGETLKLMPPLKE
ncbi:vanadium-dependent haloperoxidase [Croceicoccus gelatinilyticus]|uniref:vanadium-dependent haloperoxidase n=1 Tax=Croceicoccus gelatinilyticus TaxID=2835536 RepID=UPI001BCD27F0|nr:vanadium-dependent haloperoxidase [Croceicoccus gelatinilyticus]MBS7669623.1 vanadium-dependent haloperoxidase [Croceicoccus gelatinilyticus]